MQLVITFVCLFLVIGLVSCDSRKIEANRPGIPKLDETSADIKVENRTDLVRKIQTELNSRGLNVGQVTGQMNPGTVAALEAFQSQQGLEVTGKINHETLRALSFDPKQWDEPLQKEFSE